MTRLVLLPLLLLGRGKEPTRFSFRFRLSSSSSEWRRNSSALILGSARFFSSTTTAATRPANAFLLPQSSSFRPRPALCSSPRRMTDPNDHPSRAELRALRLAALEGGAPAASKRRRMTTTGGGAALPQQPPAHDVVDLCSSSDEEVNETKKKKAVAFPRARAEGKQSLRPSFQMVGNPTSAAGGCSFGVASYNLWFGSQRNGEPHALARMQVVADLLGACRMTKDEQPLLFIGLQEVVHALDDALAPLLEAQGYQLVRQALGSPANAPYGVALAVHESVIVLEAGFVPFRQTIMARGYCYARGRLPNGSLCLVLTTHLESWMSADMSGSSERVAQLREMEAYGNAQLAQGKAEVALMMGDLNWDDASKKPNDPFLEECLVQANDWRDVWVATNHLRTTVDARKGYTYDAKLNPMLGGGLRRRFDRCLVRAAPKSSLSILTTKLVGQESLPGLFFDKHNPYKPGAPPRRVPTAPSDHFGLLAELELKKPPTKKA
jgi:endonuclease/exonuclease/phosphatase family metal-dependent hydrolase